MISLFILRCTVPELGKFVDDASVKLVDEVVNAPLNVVDINEDAPVIVTLLLVLYIPWSLCLTLRTVEPLVITKGLDRSLCA